MIPTNGNIQSFEDTLETESAKTADSDLDEAMKAMLGEGPSQSISGRRNRRREVPGDSSGRRSSRRARRRSIRRKEVENTEQSINEVDKNPAANIDDGMKPASVPVKRISLRSAARVRKFTRGLTRRKRIGRRLTRTNDAEDNESTQGMRRRVVRNRRGVSRRRRLENRSSQITTNSDNIKHVGVTDASMKVTEEVTSPSRVNNASSVRSKKRSGRRRSIRASSGNTMMGPKSGASSTIITDSEFAEL